MGIDIGIANYGEDKGWAVENDRWPTRTKEKPHGGGGGSGNGCMVILLAIMFGGLLFGCDFSSTSGSSTQSPITEDEAFILDNRRNYVRGQKSIIKPQSKIALMDDFFKEISANEAYLFTECQMPDMNNLLELVGTSDRTGWLREQGFRLFTLKLRPERKIQSIGEAVHSDIFSYGRCRPKIKERHSHGLLGGLAALANRTVDNFGLEVTATNESRTRVTLKFGASFLAQKDALKEQLASVGKEMPKAPGYADMTDAFEYKGHVWSFEKQKPILRIYPPGWRDKKLPAY